MYYTIYNIEYSDTKESKTVDSSERDDLLRTGEWFDSIKEADGALNTALDKHKEKKGSKRGNNKNIDSK